LWIITFVVWYVLPYHHYCAKAEQAVASTINSKSQINGYRYYYLIVDSEDMNEIKRENSKLWLFA
jgi:hypothetical protein